MGRKRALTVRRYKRFVLRHMSDVVFIVAAYVSDKISYHDVGHYTEPYALTLTSSQWGGQITFEPEYVVFYVSDERKAMTLHYSDPDLFGRLDRLLELLRGGEIPKAVSEYLSWVDRAPSG